MILWIYTKEWKLLSLNIKKRKSLLNGNWRRFEIVGATQKLKSKDLGFFMLFFVFVTFRVDFVMTVWYNGVERSLENMNQRLTCVNSNKSTFVWFTLIYNKCTTLMKILTTESSRYGIYEYNLPMSITWSSSTTFKLLKNFLNIT